MQSSNILERVDNFFRAITPSDKICIIHDTDPDGIFSAVIVSKALERLGKTVTLRLPTDKEEYGITKRMLAEIKKNQITKLITCDFSPEQNMATLRRAEKLCEILIIDHHKIYVGINSEKIVLFKPQYFACQDPQKYCTAKLAYDSLSRVVEISDLDWMAASASISDIATEPWNYWLRDVFRKYKKPLTTNLFQSALGKIAQLVSSMDVYDPALSKKAFETFMRVKSFSEFNSSKIIKYKKAIDKELAKHKKLFKSKKEEFGELWVYKLKSRYRIHSVLSTLLGLQYPTKTIVIINNTKPMISISARRGDGKKPVNILLERAILQFKKANAGGHVTAAGAGFPRKYLNTFKKRIISEYV